jgi:hypothetical protein
MDRFVIPVTTGLKPWGGASDEIGRLPDAGSGYSPHMWEQLKRLFTGRTKAQDAGREADVRTDPAQPDASNAYVGRVSADDEGYVGETGAERRAERDK